MQFLSVSEYDRLERDAFISAPRSIIECTRPTTFNAIGFPSRIEDVRELRRYVEVFQDLRFARYLKELGGGLTADEFDLMKSVCRIVARMSADHFGEKRVPFSSILSSLVNYRQIRALYPEGDALIFEIGPGNGYLGALLLLAGHRYVSTEITPALYLYQNHLYALVASEIGGDIIELASDGRSLVGLDNVGSRTVVHVPWWKFYLPRPNFSLPVDCVTANQVLGEMHRLGLHYAVKVSAQFLNCRSSSGVSDARLKTFVTDGWGWNNPAGSTAEWVASALRGAGFTVCAEYPPSRSVLTTGDSKSDAPNTHERKICERLARSRSETPGEICVRLGEIVHFLRNLLGRDDILSDDEHFYGFTEIAIGPRPDNDRLQREQAVQKLMQAKRLTF